MTEYEAQQLIDMVDSQWPGIIGAASSLWRSFLLAQDAEIATKAVARLATIQHERPTIADMNEIIAMLSPQDAVPPAGQCATCNGDRFVVVQKVAPVKSQWLTDRGLPQSDEPIVEQYAPCPDCNSEADTSFRRTDGTKVETIDPSRVREMMNS